MAAISGPPLEFPLISGWIITTRQQTGNHQQHRHPQGSLEPNLNVVSKYTAVLFRKHPLSHCDKKENPVLGVFPFFCCFLGVFLVGCLVFVVCLFVYNSHIFTDESHRFGDRFGLGFVEFEVSHSQMYREE